MKIKADEGKNLKNESLINSFIIDTVLIEPIEKILSDFENQNFIDCDINWLNKQLEKFTSIACKLLQRDEIFLSQDNEYKILNPYLTNKYTNYFNILLNYFKTLKNEKDQ